MNVQVQGPMVIRMKRPSKKIREYVVACQCLCLKYLYFDDFTGEKDTRCSCGQSIKVVID